jgi:hypothetical protein
MISMDTEQYPYRVEVVPKDAAVCKRRSEKAQVFEQATASLPKQGYLE